MKDNVAPRLFLVLLAVVEVVWDDEDFCCLPPRFAMSRYSGKLG